jgi:alanyl aminopeptidase
MSSRKPLALSMALLLAAGCEPAPEPPRTVTNAPPETATAAAPLPPEAPPRGRLPADVHPLHYQLALEVVPARDRFGGSVDIAVSFDRRRDVVWMHAQGITAKSAVVRPDGGEPIAAELTPADKGGVAALKLARPVEPGRATLHLEFEAKWGASNNGLFKVERGGKAYAISQLESIFAREVFPCFDEPAYKTKFDVTLSVPKGEKAVFNTRAIEQADAPGGLTRVTFATTEPLPTYLLAIGAGPYEIVDAPPIAPNAVRKAPLPFRGVAVAGRGKDLAYALAETPRILAALEAYTGIPYPWDKLDIIAAPDLLGAMENAGAVTFGENLLLVEGKEPSFDQRINLRSIVAHELAHQWFGDLVTMPWWDDLWLNESFATWLSTRITADLYPSDRFAESDAGETVWAMGLDSLTSARRIHEPVTDNDGIQSAFDGITYTKGGAVLGMFEHYLGRDTFQRGLRGYLDKHRFGSATEADLVAALSEAAKVDVSGSFRSFLDQPGVPFVETRLACDAAGAKLHVKQSRYLPLGSSGDTNQSWQLPLCVRAGAHETCSLVTTREADVALDTGGKCPAWVHPNARGAGYYRFSVASEDAQKLERAFDELDARERITLGADAIAAYARGVSSSDDVLRLLPRLARDPNPEVAGLPHDFLADVSRWYERGPVREKLQDLAKKLYAPILRDLGWEPKAKDEPASRKTLRATVITTLALFAKDPATRKEAAKRGRAFLGPKGGPMRPEAVDPAFADVAVACAIDEDPALFDLVPAKLAKVEDDSLRGALARGVVLVKAPALANRGRDLMFDPGVRMAEMREMLNVLFRESDQWSDAWSWFVANREKVFAKYPPARVRRLVRFLGDLCDRKRLDDLERVIGPSAAGYEGVPRALAEATEGMRLCIARRDAQDAALAKALGAGAKKTK